MNNYCSDAHTTEADKWYEELNKHALPHLICLTHGDRLFTECKRICENNSSKGATTADIEMATRRKTKVYQLLGGYILYKTSYDAVQTEMDAIQEMVKKASKSSLQCVQIVSLKMDSDSPLKTPDGQKRIQDAGINGVKDVGKWIVKTVEEELKEAKTAQMLKHYLRLTT